VQVLVIVRNLATDATNKFDSVFKCFSVVVVAVVATTFERELQFGCRVGSSTTVSAVAEMQHQSYVVVCGKQQPDINSVIGGDTKTGCCGRMCSTRENIVLAKREC